MTRLRLPPIPTPLSRSAPTRCLHTCPSRRANPLPITAAGPPPSAPTPPSSSSPQAQYAERLAQRRRQADLLQRGKDLRNQNGSAQPNATASPMRKRFWKDVHVQPAPDDRGYTVQLDTRPVKNPLLSSPLIIPTSKPWLATAIALEWDALPSAQHALRPHLLPLTGIASRAQALAQEDAGTKPDPRIRSEIVDTVLRYLDTDTLLCFAPASSPASIGGYDNTGDGGGGLRDLQIRTATPILSYLTTSLWPGVELQPALDEESGGSIIPRGQPEQTRAVIRGWLTGLSAWDLVGLERAVLAGKSLCVAARLVGEWSEALRASGSLMMGGSLPGDRIVGNQFGVDEAVEASTLEVRWQTDRWGEVEDTHDVDREDVRRQMGMAVLAVSGIGSGAGS